MHKKRKKRSTLNDMIFRHSRILEWRKDNNISQRELAKRLKISTHAIYGWESGITAPSKSNLIRLADVMGVLVSDLIELNDKTKKKEESPGSWVFIKIITDKDEQQIAKITPLLNLIVELITGSDIKNVEIIFKVIQNCLEVMKKSKSKPIQSSQETPQTDEKISS